MLKSYARPFSKQIVIAIAILYLIAGLILYFYIGLWEVVRRVFINGIIVAAWLWSAEKILKEAPIPEISSIRKPAGELIWSLGSLFIIVYLSANNYAEWIAFSPWVTYVVFYGAVLALFIGLRYPLKELGITWPNKPGWLALLVVILINFLAGVLFQIIPPGEAPFHPASDLANQITGPWAVVILIFGLLFRAAIPEELLFRVMLQPRLARFMPVGWAILIQSLLFAAGHIPQQLMGYGRPLFLSLGYLLTVDNGLIGGFLWYRTRSLPLLLILHIFAYPRFGI